MSLYPIRAVPSWFFTRVRSHLFWIRCMGFFLLSLLESRIQCGDPIAVEPGTLTSSCRIGCSPWQLCESSARLTALSLLKRFCNVNYMILRKDLAKYTVYQWHWWLARVRRIKEPCKGQNTNLTMSIVTCIIWLFCSSDWKRYPSTMIHEFHWINQCKLH